MDDESDKKLTDPKERLDRGEYAVDPHAVADAILRRSRDMALLRAQFTETRSGPRHPRGGAGGWGSGSFGPQNACSYPSSRLVASRKLTPGEPWTTRPIQVIRAVGSAVSTAASSTVHALAGAHAHSS